MGLPYVTTFHGREFMYGNRVVRAAIRRVALRARALIAVSRHTGERLRERIGAGCPAPTIAWNGTSLAGVESPASERTPAGEGPLLFSLCRLEPRKNVAACVRACAALRRRGLRFRYVIGGRGPELASIRALVAELGLEPCVTVAGYMEPAEAAAMHRAADIFLHPQVEVDHGRDFEGFGITIADAMACGTAPIVGKDGGSKELVEHGSTGLVVDGRSDEALEAALLQLVSDEPLRRAMAQRAQAFAKANFSWERHIALILAALCPEAARQAAGEAGWPQAASTGSPG
jgi:glycosyltransferase involved in cell wall biosynthesis